jgi:hypothetical protein
MHPICNPLRCRPCWLQFVLCGLLGLTACTRALAAPTEPPAVVPATPGAVDASYAALLRADGVVFRLDPALSSVRIYAFRAGAARRFGHNHVLCAPAFTGYFFLPSQDPDGARFDLEFALDALELDNPAQRAALGESFDTVLTPALVESTREHMLGAFNLEAERYPQVRIQSLRIGGEAPKFQALIRVELHGQRREMWVPLTVRGLPTSLTVEGAMVLSQSDFGIKPYTVLGGLLAVQDQLMVEFRLFGSSK